MKQDKSEPGVAVRMKPGPALTPSTRWLMYALGLGLIPLIANSLYLAIVTFFGFWQQENYENLFYMWMIFVHLALGILLIPVFGCFALKHLKNTRFHRNRKGRRTGKTLLAACTIVLGTGVLMTARLLPLESIGGRVTYWFHVLLPVLITLLYVMHRSVGPRIRWRWGVGYGLAIVLTLGLLAAFHSSDPRTWDSRGVGQEAFLPARVRTHDMEFISERVLMMDQYCQECHPDAMADHQESVHHFSSFNNPIYLFSVRQTRDVLLARDGDVKGARFCAGCHDPVPLLSGAFDDPNYDLLKDPSANEGVNCTVCHAITNVAGTIGNGNYTIEEPLHYPFTFSKNSALRWINRQLVKAKPAFHKKTFLRPLHKKAEFCAVCHKVNIPYELNHYKAWLRGQNHYDNFLLSGVSGHGARSFYYPKVAEENCNECHMPRIESEDFGAQDGEIHDHHFPGANTAIPNLLGLTAARDLQADFLRDGQMDIDVFGIRKEARIDGALLAPLRPDLPALEPGSSYLIEVVLRTLKLGHVFTQGTSDSNEVWVEIEARIGDRVIGQSGMIRQNGRTDPWSHFVNSLILDRRGNRIEKRNVQDIFTTLYSNMMGPGTGQVVHYSLSLPDNLEGILTITAKLNYRKFDRALMDHAYTDLRKRGEFEGLTPTIPVVILCQDQVSIAVGAAQNQTNFQNQGKPQWQRWRDYGIGLFLAGSQGSNKGDLRQAALAFEKVVGLEQAIGWLDLARVHEKEGRLDEASAAIAKAINGGIDNPWTANWLTGRIESQRGNFARAIAAFDRVLNTKIADRRFDFSLDYQVIFEKARAQFLHARTFAGSQRQTKLEQARLTFEHVLELDSENLGAHYNLMLLCRLLGDKEAAAHHKEQHERYRPDDNARDVAAATYRAKSPAANRAAEAIVIYDMNRKK